MKRQHIIANATRTHNAIGQRSRVNIGIPAERKCPTPCEGIPIGAVVGNQAEKKAILEASGQGSEGQRIAWWHPICEQS